MAESQGGLRAFGRRALALGSIVVPVALLAIWLMTVAPRLLAAGDCATCATAGGPSLADQAKAIRENRSALATLLTGMIALIGFGIAWRSLEHTQQAAAHSLDDARQTRRSATLIKSAEHLASKALTLRLAAIHSLAGLYDTAPTEADEVHVREILAAFVRSKARRKELSEKRRGPLPQEVQLALTVLGRRPARSPHRRTDGSNAPIDLRDVDLRGAKLQGGNFANARFDDSDLDDVDFRSADLRGASLINSTLANASLLNARLQRADLTDVSGLGESQRREALSDGTTNWPRPSAK